MTTSYVAGTVSVSAGGRTVTGVGTSWILANVSPGFFGLQGEVGPVIPVERVVSDTELLLYVDWPGETVSGASYWLSYDTRDGQQTVNNAVRLSEYIARLDSDSLSALAGLTPAADKLPYFNSDSTAVLADFPASAREFLAGGVLAESRLPARLRADSSLISSNFNDAIENGFYKAGPAAANPPVSGAYWFLIVTRLDSTIHQEAWNDNFNLGYRRVRAANGAWSPWRLISDERGSNANGEYVRFADGTQICTKAVATGGPTINAGAYAVISTSSYPASFVVNPQQFLAYDGSWSPVALVNNEGKSTSATGSLIISNQDTVAHQFVGVFNVFAIGRWF